jgi:HNH endonuclease
MFIVLSTEYGGAGKSGRPHTFHREWKCVKCGKDVSVEVLKKYPGIDELDADLYNRLCRNRIIGDHIIRKSDGGSDGPENIQSLCLDCNADKTILEKDNRIGSVKQKALNTGV